jgi:hypothetical protein
MTTLQKQTLMEQKTDLPMCSCKREKVLYKCNEPSCAYNLKQSFYCGECRDEGNHTHFKHDKIFSLLEKTDQQWNTLDEEFKTTVKLSKASYEKMEPLIKYIESEAIDDPILMQQQPNNKRLITADFQKLVKS